MSLVNIIFVVVGISLFLLGIAVGGVIEFHRNNERSKKERETFSHNAEKILQSLDFIHHRLEGLDSKVEYNISLVYKLESTIEEADPGVTQMIDVRSLRDPGC